MLQGDVECRNSMDDTASTNTFATLLDPFKALFVAVCNTSYSATHYRYSNHRACNIHDLAW